MTQAVKQVEFEIKAPVNSVADINQLLSDVEYVDEKITIDTYFDVSAYSLFKKGIFVRLRDSHRFEIKFNSDLQDVAHTVCDEYAFKWPLDRTDYALAASFLKNHLSERYTNASNLIEAFDLKEFVTVKKERKTFRGDGILICLDEVDGLGKFIEIEATSSNKVSNVLGYCNNWGLKNMKLGYVELLLRAKNFPLYKQGRYLLEEDV